MEKTIVKYYQHKEKPDVVCEVINDKVARFFKWVWKDGVCSENYTNKEVTEDFKNAFNEVTQKEFNDVWGNKLQEA